MKPQSRWPQAANPRAGAVGSKFLELSSQKQLKQQTGYEIHLCLETFKIESTNCIRNAYVLEHSGRRCRVTGSLSTSLVEDVMSLLRSEARILSDYLKKSASKTPTASFVECMLTVLGVLKVSQENSKILFMSSLEDTCAASNDFYRMAEALELFLDEVISLLPVADAKFEAAVRREGAVIVNVFYQDAVMAAERSQVFIMREVNQTSVGNDFFGRQWEQEWTQNDVSVHLTTIFSEQLELIGIYLAEEFMYQKAVIVAAKALTCFYIRCLIHKADRVTRRKKLLNKFWRRSTVAFESHGRAIRRLADDIEILKDFCTSLAENATVLRIVNDDMYILDLIRETLSSEDDSSVESFIMVIHKQTGADMLVTQYFTSDLYMLMARKPGRKFIRKTVEQLRPDLKLLSERIRKTEQPAEYSYVSLSDMLKVMYEDRIAQGVLPACWHFLPKEIESEEMDHVVVKPIRAITRKVQEAKNLVRVATW